jgi:hypothetical protein
VQCLNSDGGPQQKHKSSSFNKRAKARDLTSQNFGSLDRQFKVIESKFHYNSKGNQLASIKHRKLCTRITGSSKGNAAG